MAGDTGPFKAFRIVKDEEGVHGAVVDASLDELTPGDVVIETAFSSVNYKDALAASGAGGIVRRFPLIGGIDVSGTVVSSEVAAFKSGDTVVVTGYGLGATNDGGYARFVRVPADWVVRLPQTLSPFEAMSLGTAGFTAALAVMRLEHMGVTPGHGRIAVTGATGGVGSMAVAALSRLGYTVTAITGKAAEHAYLRGLGAREVLARQDLQMGTRPLEKARWAGAVDAVGGDMLAWLTRTVEYRGAIASTGLTGGSELHTTVMPFILRGVSLLGIDSAMCPMEERRTAWQRLATDMKPERLDEMVTTISLGQLEAAFETLLEGKATRRLVVAPREALR
jgi:acrylyl-CoA reductase (NADPH)